MTFSEFAQTCARIPDLHQLWNQLWNLSFDLVEEELEQSFKLSNAPVTSRNLKRGMEFSKIREELEAECQRLGIQYPDLSIKAFVAQHLQYKGKSPIVPETQH